jgi:hypothetical protein
MSVCTQLSDRMPGVALGRSPWTSEEQRHLAACADCRAEWGLILAVARLGAGSHALGNPSVTAAGVLRRLRTEGVRRRSHRPAWVAAGLAAAAAAVLVVWAARDTAGGTHPAAPATTRIAMPATSSAPPDFPLPELDSLPADALDSVLRVLDEPLARAGAWELPDLEDPGDQVLEQTVAHKEG